MAVSETDLYAPVKKYLEKQGYLVKGEIKDCDVVAVRGEEPPVIVELKLKFTLQLVLQGVRRQTISDYVYLAVENKAKMLKQQRRDIEKLCRKLGLGLLLVKLGKSPRVDALLDPAPYKPRINKRKTGLMLREFQRRMGDPTEGGAARRKGIMTAYRQRVLSVAKYLQKNGPTAARIIKKEIGEEQSREILYQNYYSWFERVDRGVYQLTPRGVQEIEQWEDQSKK